MSDILQRFTGTLFAVTSAGLVKAVSTGSGRPAVGRQRGDIFPHRSTQVHGEPDDWARTAKVIAAKLKFREFGIFGHHIRTLLRLVCARNVNDRRAHGRWCTLG